MAESRPQPVSHRLATANVNKTRGVLSCDGSVIDLGWNQEPDHDGKPWVEGMHNENVWALVRRFNKAIFELKQANAVPFGGLDLVVAEESQCTPNKLRSEMERLYMGMMLGLFAFAKCVARIRSWRETRRTSALCITYFAAWYIDYLFLYLLGMLLAVIISPKARILVFPPAPLSMVDISTGGPAKPMGGTLGSTDAATGAPQNLKGESVENEASNFIASVAAIATNLMTGQDPHGAPGELEGGSKQGLKPQLDVTTMAVVKDKAEGMDRPSEDKTKVPIEETVWKQMTPLLHMVILTSDTWERLANMLVPSPPFHSEGHQLRLASYLAPLVIASIFLTQDFVLRVTTFAVGVGFFGKPIISRIYCFANRQDLIRNFHLNNTLFKGVPTHHQLALTLLRLGEASGAPIPPPARVHHEPPDEAIDIDEDVLGASLGDKPLGSLQQELEDLAERDPEMADDAGGEDTEIKQAVGHGKTREKVVGILKNGANKATRAAAGVDKIRAKAGSHGAKNRAGVVPSSRAETPIIGPVEFSARCDGQKGFLYVDSGVDKPFVGFTQTSCSENNQKFVWRVAIDDITQLRKHSGYGMKAKLAAGWATDEPIYDSLRIVDREGNHYVATALPYRDALFNRLCAISKDAKWEVW